MTAEPTQVYLPGIDIAISLPIFSKISGILDRIYHPVAKHPFAFIPVFFVILTVIRLAVEHLFFIPMAKKCVKAEGKKKILFINKFKGEGFKTLYYVFTSMISWFELLTVPPEQNWVFHVERVWTGFSDAQFPDHIYFLYSLQLGFYFHLLVYHFIEPKNKDFLEMLIHHMSTIALIAYSWDQGCMNVGYLILALHDVSDCFVGPTKMFNFAGWALSTVVGFAFLSTSWFLTRLVYFPFWVIRSVLVDYWTELVLHGLQTRIQWGIFNGLLCTLEVLHIFWFYQLTRILGSAILERRVHDAHLTEGDFDRKHDPEHAPPAPLNCPPAATTPAVEQQTPKRRKSPKAE
eukprot:GAFH01002471.1.p2 GENE.GAFH01002471.1~~GAFH01002471.1.p2  ORF type:complete len:347 (+),score=87.17 GAFH01002471.1:28-1068(+)